MDQEARSKTVSPDICSFSTAIWPSVWELDDISSLTSSDACTMPLVWQVWMDHQLYRVKLHVYDLTHTHAHTHFLTAVYTVREDAVLALSRCQGFCKLLNHG